EIALQLGHGADDGDHGLTDGARGVELLLQRDELDTKRAERLQRGQKVLGRAGQSIKPPDEDGLEATVPGRPEEPIQRGPALGGAGDAAIDELLDDRPAALDRVGPKG